MGTRSTYRVIDSYEYQEKIHNKKLVHVYFQYDGYPNGHPLDVAKWLSEGMLVNGIGIVDDRLIFNGAGCLAAQFISKYKDGPGGVYIQSADSFGESWEDYLYDIIVEGGKKIKMIAYENGDKRKMIFEGTPQEFVAWAEKE